jgi:hypothetical protein
MSYKNYVELRKQIDITINLDLYENLLWNKIEVLESHPQYQKKINFYKQTLNIDYLKEIYDICLLQSKKNISLMKEDIIDCIKLIPAWRYSVKIIAESMDEDFIASQFKLNIGNFSEITVNYPQYNLVEFSCGDDKKDIIQNFIENLSCRKNGNKIINLYVQINEKLAKQIRKDLSLGIKAGLPSQVELSETINENWEEVFRVKIEKKYLTIENNQIKIKDDNLIKWIEKYER